MLSPEVGVLQQACLFLRQDEHRPGTVGESFEHSSRLTLDASGRFSWRLATDGPVDKLSDQIRVTVVPGVLLNHVDVDPPQRGRLPASGHTGVVEGT